MTATCVQCGQPATVKFGNDPDLRGVHACDTCKKKVKLALLLMTNQEMSFEKALKHFTK